MAKENIALSKLAKHVRLCFRGQGIGKKQQQNPPYEPEKGYKFLFVCGCPRSGTTVLTQLLNWHPQISIGIERFGKLLHKKPSLFLPGIFHYKRFFKIENRDCFYNSFEFKEYSNWYCSEFSEEKYRKSIYVGDKIPRLYNFFDAINNNFINENYTIIYILRDINSVSQSYNARAHNPNDDWKAKHNFKRAVFDWNRGVSAVCQQLENPKCFANLILINYEDLFLDYAKGKKKLPIFFNKLGLNVEDQVIKGYDLLRERSHKLVAAKENKKELCQAYNIEEKYIYANAFLDKYNLIKARCI